MKEEFENSEELERSDRENIFSKVVRAGKRTYFFDVKATRDDEYYLTITESKKRVEKNGRMFFEKHKIFLYREDFEKFIEGATEVTDFIRSKQGDAPARQESMIPETVNEFTSIEFEDLDN